MDKQVDDCDHSLCATRPLRAFLLEPRQLVAGVLRRHGGCKGAYRHREDGSADGTGECLSYFALSDAHRQRHGSGWSRHQQDHSYPEGCFHAALPYVSRRRLVPGRCRHSACARDYFPSSPSMGDYPVATRGLSYSAGDPTERARAEFVLGRAWTVHKMSSTVGGHALGSQLSCLQHPARSQSECGNL